MILTSFQGAVARSERERPLSSRGADEGLGCLAARKPHRKAVSFHDEHVLLKSEDDGFPFVRICYTKACSPRFEKALRPIQRYLPRSMRPDLDLTMFHNDPILTIIKDFCAFVNRIVTNFSFFAEKLIVRQPSLAQKRAHGFAVVLCKRLAVFRKTVDEGGEFM